MKAFTALDDLPADTAHDMRRLFMPYGIRKTSSGWVMFNRDYVEYSKAFDVQLSEDDKALLQCAREKARPADDTIWFYNDGTVPYAGNTSATKAYQRKLARVRVIFQLGGRA